MTVRGTQLSVVLERYVSEDELLAVRQALIDSGLGEVGVNAGVSVEWFGDRWRGGGGPGPELGWLILILAPFVRTFLEEATKAAGKSVGSGAYDGVRELAKRLREARGKHSGEEGAIAVRGHDEAGVKAIIEADLSDEAYEQLKNLDIHSELLLTMRKGQCIEYDREAGRWKPSERSV